MKGEVKLFEAKKSRQNRNEDLIQRMKAGESLTAFNSEASWFPPRPIIKKDLNLLFGKEKNDRKI